MTSPPASSPAGGLGGEVETAVGAAATVAAGAADGIVVVVAGAVVVVVVDVVVDVDVVVVAASRGSCTGSIGDGEAGTVATRARPIVAAARTAPSDAITRRAGLRRTAGQYGDCRRQFGELGVRVLSSPSTEASA